MNTDPRFSSDDLLKVLSLSHNATAIHTSMALTVQTANDAMLAIWGKDRSVIGLPLEEALPELKGQPFIGMMQEVLKTGITHEDVNTPADLVVNGRLQTFYFDFSYRAIRNEQGETYCLLHTATDVTERYLNQQALVNAQKTEQALAREQALNEELATTVEELSATNEELKETQYKLQQLNIELEDRVSRRTRALAESEANFRTLIMQAPVAIGLFNGYEMVLDLINDKFLELWGKDRSVLGKKLEDALPELREQPFLKIMQEVYTTDIPYSLTIPLTRPKARPPALLWWLPRLPSRCTLTTE
jgi:two-component system sensor histidine kinase VicK